MIVPMKKAVIITQAKDAPDTVRSLRRLGILHVVYQQQPQGRDITSLQEEFGLLASVFNVFNRCLIPGSQLPAQREVSSPWQEVARHIIELWKRQEQLEAYGHSLHSSIAEWEPWGDFPPQELQQLQARGIHVSLYKLPQKELAFFPQDCVIKTIARRGGTNYVAVLSREKINLAFAPLALPKQGLEAMRKKLAEDARIVAELKGQILQRAEYFLSLQELKVSLEKELELQLAIKGMAEAGQISYIAGFVPQDRIEMLQAEALAQKWGLVLSDPGSDEEVPVLLRNPFWIRLINPVLRLLSITPGYRELDVSPVFLVFFSIFVGILIGDAGYGLAYFLLTLIMQRKFGKIWAKEIFFLLYLLSVCAMIWGLLTANFFGHAWLARGGFHGLIPALADDKTMQAFCFFLGALHLSLAHSWRAILKAPALNALAELGWVCVLWTAFFLARTLILAQPFPFFGKWLLSAGLALVVFFTNPQKNIFKAVGEGLGTLALSLMNNFTDVVSYVRLFAVGLAGVAIAETTNSMAGSLGAGWAAGIAGILIIVVGHALNIVLGPISVLVHGVRLNVLEFSGHASVTWSGEAYKPLEE